MNSLIGLAAVVLYVPVLAAEANPLTLALREPQAGTAAAESMPADGASDFDYSLGTWRTEVALRRELLQGSDSWAHYEGTSVVHAIWGGRANMVELDVEGPAGRIEGLSLRLYNPQARQWSLNYANSRRGAMGSPVVGEFRDGRGVFYGQETVDGRIVLVRFIVTQLTPDSWRYVQAFSDDGGATWEDNWIAIDTLITPPDSGSEGG